MKSKCKVQCADEDVVAVVKKCDGDDDRGRGRSDFCQSLHRRSIVHETTATTKSNGSNNNGAFAATISELPNDFSGARNFIAGSNGHHHHHQQQQTEYYLGQLKDMMLAAYLLTSGIVVHTFTL
ncbi:hypothetical protein TKK_0017713 [Trichogramma kaykai]